MSHKDPDLNTFEKVPVIDHLEVERKARRRFSTMTKSEQQVRIGLDRLEDAGFTADQALAILEATVTFAPPPQAPPQVPKIELPPLPTIDHEPRTSPILSAISEVLPVLVGVLGASAGLKLMKKGPQEPPRPLTAKEKLREILNVVLD